MKQIWLEICLIFIIYVFSICNCLILKGSFLTESDWVLSGKFCFFPVIGNVQYEITMPVNYTSTNMVLYYDNIWSTVYKSTQTCSEKESVGKILPLTPADDPACSINANQTNMITCKSFRSFNGMRAYWWFIVFSRCNGDPIKGLNVSYQFTFYNGDDPFYRHFSCDEMGILETSIFMLIVYTIFVIVGSIYARLLATKAFLHSTFKLFIVSLSFQFASFLFITIEYAQYTNSGIYTGALAVISRLFDAVAQTIFILLLVLLAKGYTVTRGKLRMITIIKLTIVFTAYVIAYIITFVYSEVLYDPGDINYFYSSPGGIALIIIKLVLGWVWFCYAVFFTIKNYPEKRRFYIALLVYYTIWFWSSPIIILTCNYAISATVRQKTGFIIQSSIATLGHLYLFILMFPSKVNKFFPFHVSTTRVTASADIDAPDNYPHHPIDKGGEAQFNDGKTAEMTLTEMFSVANTGQKYQLN